MYVYVLTHEQVGGEDENRGYVEILAVRTDIIDLQDLIPTEGFMALDADDWGLPEGMYPNPVERYVIRCFNLETGEPDPAIPTQFCRVQDLVDNGYSM